MATGYREFVIRGFADPGEPIRAPSALFSFDFKSYNRFFPRYYPRFKARPSHSDSILFATFDGGATIKARVGWVIVLDGVEDRWRADEVTLRAPWVSVFYRLVVIPLPPVRRRRDLAREADQGAVYRQCRG